MARWRGLSPFRAVAFVSVPSLIKSCNRSNLSFPNRSWSFGTAAMRISWARGCVASCETKYLTTDIELGFLQNFPHWGRSLPCQRESWHVPNDLLRLLRLARYKCCPSPLDAILWTSESMPLSRKKQIVFVDEKTRNVSWGSGMLVLQDGDESKPRRKMHWRLPAYIPGVSIAPSIKQDFDTL